MISNRLNILANMIPNDCKGVFDIGSDHGYLLSLIREKNKNIKLCGVENKKGPFENLKKGTKNKNIDAFLSSGLDSYSKEYNLVTLAGMGYSNIQNIVNSHLDFINNIEYFLIDSHNFIPSIRKYFIDLGYFIENEKILLENDIFYELILFKKGHLEYTKEEIEYGPILLKNKEKLLIDKYSSLNKKYLEILSNNKLDEKTYSNFKLLIEENTKIIEKVKN